MCSSLNPLRRTWISVCFAVVLAFGSRLSSGQPRPDDPPVTYEVQIDGESFQVEGGQRPIKVESKLKKGNHYTLAVRVAMTQPLRLNTVQLEYGMWAKVIDNKRKDLRVAQIVHELGFSLEITDLGQALNAKQQDELLKTVAENAVKRFTDRKAVDLKRTELNAMKIGPSGCKRLRINYTDAEGVARTCMIFVLSGEKYTVTAVAEFRDLDGDDVKPWVMSALESIQPLGR
jgi:hypothetical protein